MQQSVVIFVLVINEVKTSHDFHQLSKNDEGVWFKGKITGLNDSILVLLTFYNTVLLE